ncbi:hypothetical protein [Streptomyces virginiae]|uniref:hypothetical protein n=1 Tax=Streptomyces virginiae TaxID=1961 RepID=UPI0036C8AAE9
MRYEITAPESDFSGDSAGASFHQGSAQVDGDSPAGRAQLNYFRSSGYGVRALDEAPAAEPEADDGALFDPGEHNVSDVLAHLAQADDDERARVLAAEEAGEARATILKKGAAS